MTTLHYSAQLISYTIYAQNKGVSQCFNDYKKKKEKFGVAYMKTWKIFILISNAT